LRSALVLILVFGVTILPGVSRAENAKLAEARATYQVARAMYDAGRYAEAAVELTQAYEMSPRTPLLRYIGDCYARTARHEEAVEYYTRYLNRAPEAEDRGEVQAELERQKEQLSKERERALAGRQVPVQLMPTGKDEENPNEPDLAKGGDIELTPSAVLAEPQDGVRAIKVAKWTTAAVGLVGLAMGVTFNRLAAGKADELRQAVRGECPSGASGNACGNPGLDTPVVSYSLDHYALQKGIDSNNKAAVATLVIGGASAITSVVLFIVDSLREDERAASRTANAAARRVTVAPVVDGQTVGFAGQVRF
jgi:tetratricopeptide (TPR) repeat protein